MNSRRADNIRVLPTTNPKDSRESGVRPDTIPMINDDRGEKEEGGSSRSTVVMDRIW